MCVCSFTSIFSDSGLFGVYAACKPADAANAAHAVIAEVQALTGNPFSLHRPLSSPILSRLILCYL